MKRLNRILLILLCIEKTNLELRLSQVEEPSALPDFTINILTNYSGPIKKMAVFFSEHALEVTRIVQGMKVPVTVNAEEMPMLQGLDRREPCGVVLIMEELPNIVGYLNRTLWTPDTIFISVLINPDFESETLVEVFRTFFAENALNVFVFVTDCRNVFVYTYRPFVFSDCDSIEIVLLDAGSESFSLKNRLEDLHNCPVNVSAVDYPPAIMYEGEKSRSGSLRVKGTESDIINEVANKLNFAPFFATPKDGELWGWFHPSPGGAIGEVYLKTTHIAMGHLATTQERYVYLDMSAPVMPRRECVTWAVPVGAAKARPLWVEIYVNEFSGMMWGCMSVVFGLITFAFWGVAKRIGTRHDNAFMYAFASLIFVPVKAPKVMPLRFLFLSWVLYSLVIITSYQAVVKSKLTVPYHQQDINTFGDLLKTDLLLTGYNNTLKLLAYGAEGELKKLSLRMKGTTLDMKQAVRYIIYDRNIAYLRTLTAFKYFVSNHPQAKGQVHFMKQCAYEYYPVILLQKKSYLTDRTNEIISRLQESGILLKWLDNHIRLFSQPPSENIRLTITHMLAPFVVFFMGVILSIIAFIIEKLLHRYEKTGKNMKKKAPARNATELNRKFYY